MPSFCLVPSVAEKFKQDIISGKVDPAKLALMTSAERNAFFAQELGENNAVPVNALFESKLLLKNQQVGMVNWANQVLGRTPKVQRDIITKIQRLDKVLSATEQEAFLNDFANQRLGIDISFEEAQKMAELSKKVSDTKGKGDRLEYGRAVVDLTNYFNDLKVSAEKISLQEFKTTPGQAVARVVGSIPGQLKSVQASMDNSAIFRQGWKTLWTNPVIWAKNAIKSFSDIVRTVGGKNVIDELNADIVSRPNYELMRRGKLAVGTIEEAFPTALPEKIPWIGRVYKASQDAYTAFVHKTRADVFDKYIEIAKNSDVELTTKELQSIGSVVNSLTGRANLGPVEPVANVVNNVFFSPRFAWSHVNTLLIHPITGAGSSFARKQAAFNLLKIVIGTASVLGIAKVLKEDSVDFDPRSADFGNIKIGNTRFNVSGGMAGIVTLAARFLTKSTKSSTTGVVKKLNTGEFGSQTTKDVLYNFFENKLSPVAQIVKELLEDETFDGSKPSLGSITRRVLPISVSNFKELKDDPDSANILLAMIADGLGIGTNTYSAKTNWSQSTSKEMEQFKNQVGETKFEEANYKFNRRFNQWIKDVQIQTDFQALSSEEQQEKITNKKDEIKNSVLKEYGFKYKKPATQKKP